jgi:hypothetical protein
MPKFKITFEQQKEKVIRASSLEIAEERGKRMTKGLWILTEVREVKE